LTASTSQPAGEAEPSKDPASHTDGAIFNAYRRTQALVAIASVICVVLVWEVATHLGIPPVARLQGSLIEQPQPPLAFIVACVLYIVSVIIGILIAGRSWFFAGVFTGAIALATLSVRCGPMQYVLFNAAALGDTKRIFLKLLAEHSLLFVPVAATWTFFWRRYAAAVARATPQETDPLKPLDKPVESTVDDSPSAIFGALVAQIVTTGLLTMFLAVTTAKKQVAVAVLIGTFSGTALGEYLFPNRKAALWYWIGPFLVGAVGYVAAFIYAGAATIGTAQGPLANLANATPLDFAGAGMIGVLMGYWFGGDRPDVVFALLGGMAAGARPLKLADRPVTGPKTLKPPSPGSKT
jgi:hypothetical protein